MKKKFIITSLILVSTILNSSITAFSKPTTNITFDLTKNITSKPATNTTSKPATNTTSKPITIHKEGWYVLNNSYDHINIYNKNIQTIGKLGKNAKVYYHGSRYDYNHGIWCYVSGQDTTGKNISGYIYYGWLLKK